MRRIVARLWPLSALLGLVLAVPGAAVAAGPAVPRWRDISPDVGIAHGVDVDLVRGDVLVRGLAVWRRASGASRWSRCAPLRKGLGVARPISAEESRVVLLPAGGVPVVSTVSGALVFGDSACRRWRVARPRLDGERLQVRDLERSGDRLLAWTAARGLVASDDAGVSWRRAGARLPFERSVRLTSARDGSVVLALLGGDSARLACSADRGETFRLTDVHVDGAAAEPGGRVWVGAGEDVLFSDDGCRSWRVAARPGGSTTVVGAGPGRVWVWTPSRVVFGDGATWRSAGEAASYGAVQDRGSRALLGGWDGVTDVASGTARPDEAGLRSLPVGHSFEASGDGSTIVAWTVEQLRVSRDHGRTWQMRRYPQLSPAAYVRYAALLARGRLVVSDGHSFHVSDDGAASWRRVGALPVIGRRAVDPIDRGRMWAMPGDGPGEVRSSDDDGRSWQTQFSVRGGGEVLRPVADRGRTAWLVSRRPTERLVRSVDGGRTWRRLPAVPTWAGSAYTVRGADGVLVADASAVDLIVLGRGAGRWRPWTQGLPRLRLYEFRRMEIMPGSATAYRTAAGRLWRRHVDAPRWEPVPGTPDDVDWVQQAGDDLLVHTSERVLLLEGA